MKNLESFLQSSTNLKAGTSTKIENGEIDEKKLDRIL